MADYKSFAKLAKTLRTGAAAGMNAQITLEPESALGLAEILEAYEAVLRGELQEASENALAEFFEKGGKSLGEVARNLGI